MIAAVVLAAGAARRFGSQKLLAPLGGAPLVRRTVERVLAARVDEVLVVLGREGDAVREALAGMPVRFAANPRFAEGMGTSLRVGVEALAAGTRAAVIALGDQPGVRPEVIDALIALHGSSGRPIAVPLYRGARGHPVLFASNVFAELWAVEGDRGARDVIARDPARVATLSLDLPEPPDVDDAAAYEALLRTERAEPNESAGGP